MRKNRYLELADWELKEALQSAKEDNEWEREGLDGDDDDSNLKAGQIGIRINFSGGMPSLDMKGTGRSPNRPNKLGEKESNPKQKVVIHATLPAIATKSVLAEDLYNVS